MYATPVVVVPQSDARCRVRSEAHFTPHLGIPLKIAAKFAEDPELALRPSAGLAMSRDVQTRGKDRPAAAPVMEGWAAVAARGDPANTAAPLMLTTEAPYSLSGRLIAPMLGGFSAENRRNSPSAAQLVLEGRAALPNVGTLRLQARCDLAAICPRSRPRDAGVDSRQIPKRGASSQMWARGEGADESMPRVPPRVTPERLRASLTCAW